MSNKKQVTGLPGKGTLDTELSVESFMLLARKTINHLDIVVFIHHRPDAKARVSIRLTAVYPPGIVSVSTERKVEKLPHSNLASEEVIGFGRAELELHEELRSRMWFLFGVTNDEASRPICIIILPGVISSYTFKLEDENIKTFHPNMN